MMSLVRPVVLSDKCRPSACTNSRRPRMRPLITGSTGDHRHPMARDRFSWVGLLVVIASVGIVPLGSEAGDAASTPSAAMSIYRAVAGGHALRVEGNHVVIRDGVNEWWVLGAVQAPGPEPPTDGGWSVGKKPYELLVVNEPISDDYILPNSNPVPNTSSFKNVAFVAAPGEYEPASIVLRSGDYALEGVALTVKGPLRTLEGKELPAGSIDVSLVKVWYQSARAMRRTDPRDQKRLVPELLLHDSSLVKVDQRYQVNLVRTFPPLRDAEKLQPFSVPPRQNQQIWLTAKVPDDAEPGMYRGTLRIQGVVEEEPFVEQLDLTLDVLPMRLSDTTYEIGIFYLARWREGGRIPLGARAKTTGQMREELHDMKEHGVGFVGIDHDGSDRRHATLEVPLRLLRDTGFSSQRLVYVDWHMADLEDTARYLTKIKNVVSLARGLGLTDIWIYNRDERDLRTLKGSAHTFRTAHAVGAKNVVATRAKVAAGLKGLLDVAVVQHRTSAHTVAGLRKAGIEVLAYGIPHAAEETPATTRAQYGLKMAEKGFDGVFSYAYQSGDCWDDWMKWDESRYRPNVMAYPTDGKPIPTLQWEAWREAVEDLRYLATYLNVKTGNPHGEWPNWLRKSIAVDPPAEVRRKLVEKFRNSLPGTASR